MGNDKSKAKGSNREQKGNLTSRPFAGVREMFTVKSIVSGAEIDTRMGRTIDTSECEKAMKFKDGTILSFPEPDQYSFGRGCRNPLRHGWMTPAEEAAHQIKPAEGQKKACLYFSVQSLDGEGILTVGPAPSEAVDEEQLSAPKAAV